VKRPVRVVTIFGTRPEAIKMAPFVLALAGDPRFSVDVVVSAQHRSMLDQVLDLFGIQPAADLGVMRPRQSLAELTARIVRGIARSLALLEPDMVAVQGDTTTTFTAALAAFYLRIPVVHLEAGLRTSDRYSPFPEEINRRLTASLASLHLAPTQASRANLLNEGVKPHEVVVTGNTGIDALHLALARAAEDDFLRAVRRDGRRVVAVTAHRRESWGEPMHNIGSALASLATRHPDVLFVFPIHKNPVVREAIEPVVAHHENVWLAEPLPYGQFALLLKRAHLVLTDSGGIQEEAPSLGKPVLVMRETTERPEAVSAGTARLVGTDRDAITGAVSELLEDPAAYAAMANAVNPYGDGRAAARSVAAVAHYFGLGPRPAEFAPSTGVEENPHAAYPWRRDQS
jgi:UDP-N-acetylglucosamine 2-epimerase (non-hydrolysing)